MLTVSRLRLELRPYDYEWRREQASAHFPCLRSFIRGPPVAPIDGLTFLSSVQAWELIL